MCRVLYGSGDRFACRTCSGLHYARQYKRGFLRDLDRLESLRKLIGRRLGREFDSGEDFPPKPPYMRWRTYRALEQRWDAV